MIRAFLLAIVLCPSLVLAEIQWDSAATGTTLSGDVLEPAKSSDAPLPTVVYLKNLSIPRLGQESDDAIIADLRNTGHLVLVLHYAHHPRAISPDLNADVLKLRRDIVDTKNKTLLADHKIDV